MELNPALKSVARRWLPAWFLARLDPVEARIHSAVRRFAGELAPGSVVLDAGCGENPFKSLFPHCCFVGCDLGVGEARWDYSRMDAAADLRCLPFGDRALDASLGIVVLEHVPEPAQVLGELARVLKPGGTLLLILPLLWEVHQAPHDYFRFTRFGAEHLLEAAGFEIRRLEPLGGFFTLLARRCVNALAFFQESWKWFFFILLAPWLGLIFPLLLPALDRLDRRRDFTLGYEILAVRRGNPNAKRQ